MKRIADFIFAATAMVAAAFLVSGCRNGHGDRTGVPVPVKVMTVEKGSNTGEKTYVGTVVPSRSAVLSCSYAGTLVSLRVSEGDAVRQGDTLAVIESQAVISSWKMAHASLAQAEDGYRRLSQVHGSGSVPDVKMVEVETQLDKARASAEAADRALADCTVKAPFDGVVDEIFAEQGVSLAPVAPLFRLLDISSVEIEIPVPEGEISGIGAGDAAEVAVPALDGMSFRADVASKGVAASPLSHSYRCRLLPAGNVSGLMPGMVCKVTLASQSEGIVIPASVVRTDADGRYVWIVDGDRVGKRYVSVGGFSGRGISVESGLQPGDRVICEGIQKVSSGMRVQAMEMPLQHK